MLNDDHDMQTRCPVCERRLEIVNRVAFCPETKCKYNDRAVGKPHSGRFANIQVNYEDC